MHSRPSRVWSIIPGFQKMMIPLPPRCACARHDTRLGIEAYREVGHSDRDQQSSAVPSRESGEPRSSQGHSPLEKQSPPENTKAAPEPRSAWRRWGNTCPVASTFQIEILHRVYEDREGRTIGRHPACLGGESEYAFQRASLSPKTAETTSLTAQADEESQETRRRRPGSPECHVGMATPRDLLNLIAGGKQEGHFP